MRQAEVKPYPRFPGSVFGFAIGGGPNKLSVVTTQAKQLTKQALALKPEERIELAEILLTSVDGFASAEIEAAWTEEVGRRVKEIETGQAKLIPAEEVHRKARALVHEARRLSLRR
jgi:putative addiction module component (TIGR02574 family)